MTTIYKIVPRALWLEAEETGSFAGSPVDHADGFIHFSGADQVVETARRHFSGERDLLLVAVDAERLGDALRWETSRGGAAFPHLYGALSADLALWARPLPLAADGTHAFRGLVPGL